MPPPTYRTRKRPAYDEAPKRRGSLTLWFDPEVFAGDFMRLQSNG